MAALARKLSFSRRRGSSAKSSDTAKSSDYTAPRLGGSPTPSASESNSENEFQPSNSENEVLSELQGALMKKHGSAYLSDWGTPPHC